jgi:hypothetical protein
MPSDPREHTGTRVFGVFVTLAGGGLAYVGYGSPDEVVLGLVGGLFALGGLAMSLFPQYWETGHGDSGG